MATFTNQPISSSYYRVLQIDGGQIQDGLGNPITASILAISASQGFTGSLRGTASFAISASYAATASSANTFIVRNDLLAPSIASFRVLYKSGSAITGSDKLQWNYLSNGLLIYGNSSSLQLSVNPNSSDGVGLGALAIMSADESGLYSQLSDQPIAVYSAASNSFYYSNGDYRYDDTTGIHQLTGSVQSTAGFTGSLFGTSSWAVSASWAPSTAVALAVSSSGSTIYSINPSTSQFSTNNNILLGNNAGFQAINIYHSNFIGSGSGYQATDAYYSNFLGLDAGSGSINASAANFLGYQAGADAGNSSGGNFLGYQAGYKAINAYGSNFLGYQAGLFASGANDSNFLGQSAGNSATLASYSNFLGTQAGNNAINAQYSNFLGTNAGNSATNASASNFIGLNTGINATNADNSNFIGQQAGFGASSAAYSTFIGYRAGASSSPSSNNIIIGTNITLPVGTKGSVNIGGIIFATGSYGVTTGDAFSGSVVNGRVGINVTTPSYNFEVSGTVKFNQILNLVPVAILPAGSAGDVAVSGSAGSTGSLYFYDGNNWKKIV